MPNSSIWVAKIGGSLRANARLAGWLAALRKDRRQRWLLVPGGGPYADAVREEQLRLGYSDGEAHRRAFAAMARYAADLFAVAPGYVRADSIASCFAHARAGDPSPVLWLPAADDAARLTELPADWRVSSDSIAHALATRIGAAALLLVKSVAPPRGAGAKALAAAGWVDAWFPHLMARSQLAVYWTTMNETAHELASAERIDNGPLPS